MASVSDVVHFRQLECEKSTLQVCVPMGMMCIFFFKSNSIVVDGV